MAKRGVSLLFCKTPIVLSCQSVWMSGLYRFDCFCETDVTIDSSLTCVFRNLKQAVRFILRARTSSLMSTLQISSVFHIAIYRFDCYCETDVTIDSSLTCVFRNPKQAVRFILRARASSLMGTLQIFSVFHIAV